MKRWLFSFLILAIGVGLGVSYKEIKEEVRRQRKDKLVRIAKATHPVLEDKPFVILTMSYNNSSYCEKNLLSILEQDYDNFRVIYVDDCSTDDTFSKVQTFLTHHDKKKRVTVIQNKKNQGALENLYRTIHGCRSDEIMVIVDGDDFLAHSNVLKKLNQYYADPDVWITYGSFMEYPSYLKGNERQVSDSRPLNLKIVKERGIRKHAFVTGHLQTFYAGLFKRIKLQDFLYEGEFFSMTYDLAIMLPMIELAHDHAYFVPDIFYLYNISNPICDYKKDGEKQASIDQYIRGLPPYLPLLDHPKHDFIEMQELVDIVSFSYNRPLQLYAFLESVNKYIKNAHRIFVIYRSENQGYDEGYEKVRRAFPNVIYSKQSYESPYQDFAPLVYKAVFDPHTSHARYVAFAADDLVVKDYIDLSHAVCQMKKTGAYGFYFWLGSNVNYCLKQNCESGVPKSIYIGDDVYAWQFLIGKGEWMRPNNFDLTLYKKEELRTYFDNMRFHNPYILEALWNELAPLCSVGLYYDHSKIIHIPLNIVLENKEKRGDVRSISPKQLLRKFEDGFKMNIVPFHQIENRSPHIEYIPEFIKREE